MRIGAALQICPVHPRVLVAWAPCGGTQCFTLERIMRRRWPQVMMVAPRSLPDTRLGAHCVFRYVLTNRLYPAGR